MTCPNLLIILSAYAKIYKRAKVSAYTANKDLHYLRAIFNFGIKRGWIITNKETMVRVGEINRMTGADVNFDRRYVVLYTRKKRGGHLTPRKIPMTRKLFEVLSLRYRHRDKSKPWVFWHRYWCRTHLG